MLCREQVLKQAHAHNACKAAKVYMACNGMLQSDQRRLAAPTSSNPVRGQNAELAMRDSYNDIQAAR